MFAETLRRQLRKTPTERLDALIFAANEDLKRGFVPASIEERRRREREIRCSIQERLSRPSSPKA